MPKDNVEYEEETLLDIVDDMYCGSLKNDLV